jgi:RNA polymerase sigma factor (sigma-70 family)
VKARLSVIDHAHTNRTDTSALVDAARRGDQAALDQLVTVYLPLVYNVVGRALARSADVDDVVQDTMLRVVRGLAGVRDPRRFRSWLVAVTMNQIREYQQSRRATPAPSEHIDSLVDPGSDFADLTVIHLSLSGQRREVALATGWLDDDYRHLLSLWWLVEAGHLSRVELVEALGLDPHHVTVRLARMKAQLDTARLVVRALTTRTGCVDLTAMVSGWDGRPTPVWRKRFAKHIRSCALCPDTTSDLVPAERLLAGLALTPVAAGLAAHVIDHAHTVATTAPVRALGGAHAKTGGVLHQARLAAASAPKSLLAIAVSIAVVGGVLLAGYAVTPTRRPAAVTGAQSSTPVAVAASASAASPFPTALTPTPAAAPSPSSSPTRRPTPTKPSSTSNGLSPDEQRLLVLLNERRRALGLSEVQLGTQQRQDARACVQKNLDVDSFQHCGFEALWESTGTGTPEEMIQDWFNSDAHRKMLTMPSSRYAGPAIGSNGKHQIAAINIDY